MDQKVLEVRSFTLRAPDGKLLRSSIDFKLNWGELLCVRGDNGSGKSTLARNLFVQNEQAGISWKVTSQHRGYLPQVHQSQLFLPLTILDVISIFKKTTPSETSQLGLLPIEKLSLKWNSASGGEQKRALLTRIFLDSPQVLCLDEPFNNLDFGSKQVISEFLVKFLSGSLPNQSFPGAVILISHENLIDSSAVTVREYRL